ncbi:MAG: hypothetical protein HFG00_02530 [Oscillibacter sp.]|nr:hypothetical protein [Oscillibacter sp.]
MTMKQAWTRYLTPGLVFQSILIGGGYGTGAEIARYFGVHGLLGGLLALGAAAAAWALVCAVTFSFVQTFRTYDYGSLMKRLLGRAGLLYDICFYAMLLIVLGVVNATAGAMAAQLGLPAWAGVGVLSGGIVFLVLEGTEAMEKALSLWSYLLYAVYLLFLFAVFLRFGDAIRAELALGEILPGWLGSGLRYASYNLFCVSMVLYTLRNLETRREAALCGVLAGLLGAVPALLLLLAMGCALPDAVAAETPVAVIFSHLDLPWLKALFQLVLFGTLVETGAGFIKAMEDRLEKALFRGGTAFRPLLTLAAAAAGAGVSAFGLTELIAGGYGALCWGALFLFALPMLTVGVHMLRRAGTPLPRRRRVRRLAGMRGE